MVDRPLRVCDVCGQIDDHPRAIHLFGPGEAPPVPTGIIAQVARSEHPQPVVDAAIAELSDPTSTMRHHDCCVAAGCPDQDRICEKVLAAATGSPAGGPTGDALLKKLQSPKVAEIGAELNDARAARYAAALEG